jgi:hypothetical protein
MSQPPPPCTQCGGQKGHVDTVTRQAQDRNGAPVTVYDQHWVNCQGCGGTGVEAGH